MRRRKGSKAIKMESWDLINKYLVISFYYHGQPSSALRRRFLLFSFVARSPSSIWSLKEDEARARKEQRESKAEDDGEGGVGASEKG